MKEYVEAEGTKRVVTEAIMQAFGLEEETSNRCLTFIKSNQEILSDEEFFQYSNLEEYETDGVSEFISEEGKYYISIKKSTILLVSIFLRETVPYFGIIEDIGVFFGLFNLKGSFTQLDTNQDYLCILLELTRNRKHGADKNMLKKYKGECCNNQLKCKYNLNGMCSCGKENVEEICEYLAEQAVIKRRGRKYFYVM